MTKKESSRVLDRSKKEDRQILTRASAGLRGNEAIDMGKTQDYKEMAGKKFDEKLSKEISTHTDRRSLDAKTAKEAEQQLLPGEKLITQGGEFGTFNYYGGKEKTAEGDEELKKFYTENYDEMRNIIGNYIKNSIERGEIDPKTGQFVRSQDEVDYGQFKNALINPIRNDMSDKMRSGKMDPTRGELLQAALEKAQIEAENDAFKSNLGKGGDKKGILGKVSDFFKGIQGVEAGTAGDMAGEAAMATDESTSPGKDKGKDKSKTSFFSKFLSGMSKLSPTTALAAYAAEAVRGKTPGKGDFEFGETPDMPGESTRMTKVYNRKPKTRSDVVEDDTMKMVLNPEDGNYYPPDSPILNKFKPNQLRSVKDILASGQSTQQASTMAVANNNVNNVSNNSNQNIYTGKLNVDVDSYAERVNDF